MPVLQKFIPSGSEEFLGLTLILKTQNKGQEAVKEEETVKFFCQVRDIGSNFRFNQFNRPEPAYELHYCGSMSQGLPNGSNLPRFRDCLIFPLRSEFIMKGQGRVTETGYVYRVKDEEWIWLCGTTTLVVMEEGEQRGVCRRRTQEERERILAEMKSPKNLKRPRKSHDALQLLQSSARLHRPW
jgi:hypothetical protein